MVICGLRKKSFCPLINYEYIFLGKIEVKYSNFNLCLLFAGGAFFLATTTSFLFVNVHYR